MILDSCFLGLERTCLSSSACLLARISQNLKEGDWFLEMLPFKCPLSWREERRYETPSNGDTPRPHTKSVAETERLFLRSCLPSAFFALLASWKSEWLCWVIVIYCFFCSLMDCMQTAKAKNRKWFSPNWAFLSWSMVGRLQPLRRVDHVAMPLARVSRVA